MKLNKNIIIAILLLSFFAVGTMNLLDTVEAAKWKKFDSGTFTVTPGAFSLDSTFNSKKKVSFVSYSKGSNQIKMNFYAYKKKNNKKAYESTTYYTKSGKEIKSNIVDYKGQKSSGGTATVTSSLKSYYKTKLSSYKNIKSSTYKNIKYTSTSNSGSGWGGGKYAPIWRYNLITGQYQWYY